jgi:hypothetical protein
MRVLILWLVAALFLGATVANAEPTALLVDEFDARQAELWQDTNSPDDWSVSEGVLRRTGSDDGRYTASVSPRSDISVETRVKLLPSPRKNFGIAVRLEGSRYLLVRYYDQPQALEVLDFQSGGMSLVGSRSEKLSIEPNRWYRLKIAAVGDRVVAKIWPDQATEPEWQLDVQVPHRDSGSFALVGHDDTQLEFDWVRANSHDDSIALLQAEAQRKRELLLAELELAAAVMPSGTQVAAKGKRRLSIVPYAKNDRAPVEGQLSVTWDGGELTRAVTLADYRQQGIEVELPQFDAAKSVQVTFDVGKDKQLKAGVQVEPAGLLPWRSYVQNCLSTLVEHGRDEYGDVHSPLFMAVLDADTLRSPGKPMLLGSLVRLEDRLHRRGERGANPWYDQSLHRSLRQMSDLTGDDKYRQAADDAISYFLEHCRKGTDPQQVYLNGMPAWGTHVYWDCYRDEPAGDGDGNGPHEILVYGANWDQMHRLKPHATRHLVDGIWEYHLVDKSTGLHNRHDDARAGCDFAFSGSSFACAMASMYQATGQQRYLEQARTIADWHWLNRNEQTGLTADTPGLTDRYDGNHCFTTVVGPHALGLLECYRMTGDEHFRNVAITYIKAFDRYGWDETEQTYWAMLKLDGTPVPEQPKGQGYDAFAPYGHVDVWRSTIYSYEFTLAAGQAAMAAYETTVRDGRPDAELLKIAKRWGQVVEQALPPKSSRRWKSELEAALPEIKETGGAYAEDYGRAISLFVHLYRATDDRHFLELAEKLAGEAVAKLYRNDLFVGHPAKPYYETTDGVGLLLEALLELDAEAGKMTTKGIAP